MSPSRCLGLVGVALAATFACPDPSKPNAPSEVPIVYARFDGVRGGTGSAYTQEIVDAIDAASYEHIHRNELFTRAGHNKGINGAEHDLCRDAIKTRLESYGLSAELHPFLFNGQTYHNVIGTQVGVEYPDSYIIVSAHYDTVNNPGADDDASGVAAFLEIARVLSRYETAYTVKYIGWDREEQGKVGSTRYAQQFASDDIVAVVQIDMVAHDVGN
ncbi:MAG: M28 family metallopeptidase, partial [Phycisphaerales bacterium]